MTKHIFTALNLEDERNPMVGLFTSEADALDACGHSVLSEAQTDGFLIHATPISDFGWTPAELKDLGLD